MSILETSPNDHPPTDVERFQVVARLIEQRLADLYTARTAGSCTPAESREIKVLEAIRKDWILEHRE